jgi:hypothetical protein
MLRRQSISRCSSGLPVAASAAWILPPPRGGRTTSVAIAIAVSPGAGIHFVRLRTGGEVRMLRLVKLR